MVTNQIAYRESCDTGKDQMRHASPPQVADAVYSALCEVSTISSDTCISQHQIQSVQEGN
jgi:hypothetical protein